MQPCEVLTMSKVAYNKQEGTLGSKFEIKADLADVGH